MSRHLHPGTYLAEEIRKRGWSQADLGFVLGCNPKAINQIVNAKQGISAAMSRALGDALGLPGSHFADLQTAFDVASASEPDPAVSLRAKLASAYPIRDMMKRGWLTDRPADLGAELARFFGVDDPNNVPRIAHSAKKTSYSEDISPPQLAWLYRVRQIAKRMAAPKYSQRSLADATIKMRALLTAPEEARHAPKILHECGIRFVVVEPLPQSKIDGVCFWLDNRSPVIGLSMRFDRIDNFWFVLRHEIEHALRDDGKGQDAIDTELVGERAGTGDLLPPEERAANAAAADFCVAADKMDFHRPQKPAVLRTGRARFFPIEWRSSRPAGWPNSAPNRQTRLSQEIPVKVRQFVLPGARVDGWGQTAMIEGAAA